MITMPPDMRLAAERDIQDITASPLFDAAWYVARHPDVTLLNMNPAEHYLWLGARIGRNPSPAFDTNAYKTHHPDVARTGANPLLHYLRHGQREKREIFAVADDDLRAPFPEDMAPGTPRH